MQIPDWLFEVHHDGSKDYVSNLTPVFGERVKINIRVPVDAPVRRVLLRTFPDGEQALQPLQKTNVQDQIQWFSGDLIISMPLNHYRFILETEGEVWIYNARGIYAMDPTDVDDFKVLANYQSPDWVKEAVFYQIFPDRFYPSTPGRAPGEDEFDYRGNKPRSYKWGESPDPNAHGSLVFYGGDLPGIQSKLDYLQDLGVTALYLTPIFSAYSNHKYDVVDYDHVDVHFGGDQAFSELRCELDRRGMRCILDIVPNHCGFMHPWFQKAQHDPESIEAEFFTFQHHPDEYTSWVGVWTLPKFNYRSAELRRRMYGSEDSIFRKWLREPFRMDGLRVDVGNMLGRQGETQLGHEVVREIRKAVKETNTKAYLVAENFFDASLQLQGDEWDAVMNYGGVMVPILNWLRGYRNGAIGLREPLAAHTTLPTEAFVEAIQTRLAAIPWVIALQQYNILDSHDTTRIINEVNGNKRLQKLAAIFQFCFPGTVGIYYGDEIGMGDVPGLRSRGCMVWEETNWDRDLFTFYQSLIHLRKSNQALCEGGFQILGFEKDLVVFQRELGVQKIIVALQRAETPRRALPFSVKQGGISDGSFFKEYFSQKTAIVENGLISFPELEQGGSIWILD